MSDSTFQLLLLISPLEPCFLIFLLTLPLLKFNLGEFFESFLLKAFLFVFIRHLGTQIHLKFLLCCFFTHANSVNLDLKMAHWSAYSDMFSKELFISALPKVTETEIFSVSAFTWWNFSSLPLPWA